MNKNTVWRIGAVIVLFFVSTSVFSAGDVTAGKEKAKVCTSCHGVDGEGIAPKTKISGLSVGTFSAAMKAYKNGEREHAMMQMFSKKLNDQDIDDLAAYYSTK